MYDILNLGAFCAKGYSYGLRCVMAVWCERWDKCFRSIL